MASDDDRGTSGTLQPGQPAHGNFESGNDQDWFKVWLDSGSSYAFAPQAFNVNGLALHDASGALLQSFHFSPATFSWDARYTPATSGYYYLAAAGGATGAGAYTIAMQSLPLVEDSGAPAGSTPLLALGAPRSAILQGPIDSDSFKLSVKAGLTYALEVAAGAGPLGTNVELVLPGHAGRWFSGAGSHSFTPERDGEVTVTVRQQGYQITQPESNLNYALTARLAPDDYAANAAGAGRVAVGASVSGQLEAGGGDRDWIAVDLQAGQTYWFELDGDAARPGTIEHLELRLLNSASWAEASVRAAAGFDLPVLAYTPTTSGTYYLDLNNQYGGSGGYRLTAAIGSPDDSDDARPRQLDDNSPLPGVFEVGGDSDVFQFSGLANHVYEITLEAPHAPRLDLAQPGLTNSWVAISAGQSGARSISTYQAWGDGLVQLRLTDLAGHANAAYAVKVRDAGLDDHPFYNPQGYAALAVGASVRGVLEASGDEDTFRVQVERGKHYVFELSGAASGGGSLDAASAQRLYLLHNGVPLGSADTGAGEARWTYSPSADGELQVLVLAGIGQSGSYTLRAHELGGPAPALVAGPAASIALHQGLSLQFSESVRIDPAKVHLRDAGGAELAHGASALQQSLLVDPHGLLRPGQTYRLELDSGAIRDLAGNRYQGPSSFSFSTAPATTAATAGDDLLAARAGLLDGGAGTDVAVLAGARSDYTLSRAGGQLSFSPRDGSAAVVLQNIERVWFADQALALDSAGSGGQVYRLYQAAFNRAPDGVGLGFWTYQHDHGMPLERIAAEFIASAEFIDLYGMAPSNAEFVDRLYHNVLHRAGEPGGVAHWNQVLDGGYPRAGVLAAFSESPENVAAMAAVLAPGFSYEPW